MPRTLDPLNKFGKPISFGRKIGLTLFNWFTKTPWNAPPCSKCAPRVYFVGRTTTTGWHKSHGPWDTWTRPLTSTRKPFDWIRRWFRFSFGMATWPCPPVYGYPLLYAIFDPSPRRCPSIPPSCRFERRSATKFIPVKSRSKGASCPLEPRPPKIRKPCIIHFQNEIPSHQLRLSNEYRGFGGNVSTAGLPRVHGHAPSSGG